MKDQQLRILLEQLSAGQSSVDETVQRLQSQIQEVKPLTAVTNDARVDLDRRERCGFSEVVYCPGKSEDSIVQIFGELHEQGQDCLGTRVSESQASRLLSEFPAAIHDCVARTVRWMNPANDPATVDAAAAVQPSVAILSAGTSDAPVAREALETLRWMRCEADFHQDVGVAGPHRLREVLPRLQNCRVVIVVAGMEGALPSVAGGYLSCPIIAVPTSVGYGTSFNGLTALLGMLNSCAANVCVVNIDAGFKAAHVAGMIVQGSRHTGSGETNGEMGQGNG